MSSDSDILTEIKALITEGDIEQSAALRLMLASQLVVSQQLDRMTGERDRLEKQVENIKDCLDAVDKKTDSVLKKIQLVEDNPAVKLGSFISSHKKTTTALIFSMMLFFSIAPGFLSTILYSIMVVMGVPSELLTLLFSGVK